MNSRGMSIQLSVSHVFKMYSATGRLCSLVCRVRGPPPYVLCFRAGVPNQSIASYRSIAKGLTVDRGMIVGKSIHCKIYD